MSDELSAEGKRLAESQDRTAYWKRWGPYLAERAWGTVREDYSPNGDAWQYLPHDEARSRAYRWSEDGILGICDNHQYLCFALAFWNGKDPILKERPFGLTNKQGNHGEDVKELYYYLDATPTASYLKGLYKYPQAAYPYENLIEENARRTRHEPEFELQDTGVFNESRYFDIFVEYAKNGVDDIFIRVTLANRGPDAAELTCLPTLWFRNTWDWNDREEPSKKPSLSVSNLGGIRAEHPTLGSFLLKFEDAPELMFTENETNTERLWGERSQSPFCKDGFGRYLIDGQKDAVNAAGQGTKACAVYRQMIQANSEKIFRFRFCRDNSPELPTDEWDRVFAERIAEAKAFYSHLSPHLSPDEQQVQRQAFAGMFWSKQFYHFVIETWLNGDPGLPPPPEERKWGRDHRWRHLFNEDVISMPDKWEYPWYASWDLAFHTVAIAPADPDFSKSQLGLLLREWYMHPNGQIPAYEWAFGDVNPPVHAWATYRVFKIDARLKGKPDFEFLEGVFHKLLMNFTWWVNRKDSEGANIFEGGFLGLDNIGIFNRETGVPPGWLLEQSDGTSWMGMYCLNMLKIALELSDFDEIYEDIASKFFEHFLYIADAINHNAGVGLWDEEDGFYYDRLRSPDDNRILIRIRSLVGLTALFATDTLEQSVVDRHPGFRKRMQWFIDNRPDLTGTLASLTETGQESRRLLSIANRERLERILQRVFDESEFLSPCGIRSLSRFYKDHPYTLEIDDHKFCVSYEPGDSQSGMFGGNSNWRGPVWFPMNFLVIEALQRLGHYFGDSLQIECPSGSGHRVNLTEAATELSRRLCGLFLPNANADRPVYAGNQLMQQDPHFRNYILFHEFFNGDTGKGLGASHQTGWTGLVAKLLEQTGRCSTS